MEWTRQQEINQIEQPRPHLVILGAGASRAACPHGDANGYRLPVMADFVETLELQDLISHEETEEASGDFEKFYSRLAADPNREGTRRDLEQRILDYFSLLKLPDQPTIYDHLVLSLRPKDVIATFNWDPFLIQAAQRNGSRFKSPRILFLHGCVMSGYCEEHKCAGVVGSRCRKCGGPLKRSNLLYPIEHKDYTADAFLDAQWREVQATLTDSFMLTVFGYGAPTSDREAVELMRAAWGAPALRSMEQIEIIDIKAEDELHSTWRPLIHSHHYEVHASFYDSWIARHPRRTGEAYVNQYIHCFFIEDNPIPREYGFADLWGWLDELKQVEEQKRSVG